MIRWWEHNEKGVTDGHLWRIWSQLPWTVAKGQSHCASNIISNSHPFHSKWVPPPIPEIQLFKNWTLKIQGQGQGHGSGELCWKSQHGSNILLTHVPFVLCQSAILFLSYDFFKIWPWKSKVKVEVKVELSYSNCGAHLASSCSADFRNELTWSGILTHPLCTIKFTHIFYVWFLERRRFVSWKKKKKNRQNSKQSVENMLSLPEDPRHLLPGVIQIRPGDPKYDQFH